MRLSRFFLPVLKETPAEAEIVSHQMMLRTGMIRQTSAGIYAWLPLGLRVLRKIEAIIRQEQDRFGAQELLMPTIQSADLWRESGRYDDYGKEMLRIRDRHERDMLYGPTNEEMITDLFRRSVRSYRDLPLILYHMQWKFRDEIRPRFGVMRGREFLMKDAYSFDIDASAARHSYHAMFVSYLHIFARMGLRAVPVRAETGPIGGELSHEFHILADTGESDLFVDKALVELDLSQLPQPTEDLAGFVSEITQLYAAADEMHVPAACPLPDERLLHRRGIEVGHIFNFGEKYSAPMKAQVTAPDGGLVSVNMGSYGVGISRLPAAIIEASHDAAGVIWPDAVAPFHVGLINLKPGDGDSDAACDRLYRELTEKGFEVLLDDTEERPGAKFATMDLIGLPWQVIVGPRGLSAGKIEVKRRATGERAELAPEEILGHLGPVPA